MVKITRILNKNCRKMINLLLVHYEDLIHPAKTESNK